MTVRVPWRAVPPVSTPLEGRALVRYLTSSKARDAAHDRLRDFLLARLSARLVIGTDSGTSALRLAIESAVHPDGVVALPAYGCFDLITAAVGARRRVALYDVEPATLAPDPSSLQAVLEAGAGAVVAASIFGYAPPMSDIAEVTARFGAALIEDVAQGAEATWDGRYLGSWGDFVVLSFGRGKGLGGAGGGALIVRGRRDVRIPELPEPRAGRGAVGAASLVAQSVLAHPLIFALPTAVPFLRLGETIYHEPWSPHRLHPLQAALAHAALERGGATRAGRTRRAAEISRAMAGVEACRVVVPHPRSGPSFLRMGILTSDGIVERLHSLGARRSYPMPLQDHPALQPLLTARFETDGAVTLARELASLPTHDKMNDDDIAQITRDVSG